MRSAARYFLRLGLLNNALAHAYEVGGDQVMLNTLFFLFLIPLAAYIHCRTGCCGLLVESGGTQY